MILPRPVSWLRFRSVLRLRSKRVNILGKLTHLKSKEYFLLRGSSRKLWIISSGALTWMSTTRWFISCLRELCLEDSPKMGGRLNYKKCCACHPGWLIPKWGISISLFKLHIIIGTLITLIMSDLIWSQQGKDGWTALHHACYWNKATMVDRLLKVSRLPMRTTARSKTNVFHTFWNSDKSPELLMLILKRTIFAGARYQSEPEVCGRLHPDHASTASLQARLCPGDDAGRLSFLASNCLCLCLTHGKPDCVQAMMRVGWVSLLQIFFPLFV